MTSPVVDTMTLCHHKSEPEPVVGFRPDFHDAARRITRRAGPVCGVGRAWPDWAAGHLPALTGIAPILTPLAATGIAVIMVLAVGVHARRKEPSGIATTLLLLALAAIVAWGRFGPYAA